MATVQINSRSVPRGGLARSYDDAFFVGMSLLLLLTVLVGFARSYFLAGMLRAHLPNVLIHLHAVAFTLWILLLVTQSCLISVGRPSLHRKFGLFGFGLASAMIVLGVMAATNSLTRISMVGPYDMRTFYAVPMFDILVFGVLVYFAFRRRHDAAAHKRLILIASITIIDAATGRPPLTAITHLPFLNNVFTQAYVVLLAAFDWWSLRRIHRVTLTAGSFSIVMLLAAIPVGSTHAWIAFANWAMNNAKAVQS